jgi:hypothetical protein
MAYYKAPVLIADTINLNDRIYTRDVILDIVRQFNARKTPMMGALIISPDYKEISSGEISLFNMSHIVKNIKTSFDYNHEEHIPGVIDDSKLRIEIEAEIEFLETERGDLAQSMIGNLALSTRGTGMLQPIVYRDQKTGEWEGEYCGQKVSDYTLEGIDLIQKDTSSYNGILW